MEAHFYEERTMSLEKSDTSPLRSDDALSQKWADVRRGGDLLSREQRETVASAHSQQCEAFKKTLEEGLAKGVDVRSSSEYDRLKGLFATYRILPPLGDTPFESLNDGVGITLKNVGGLLKVYNNPDSAHPHSA